MRKFLYILLLFSFTVQAQLIGAVASSGSSSVSYDITSMSYDSKSYDPSTQTGTELKSGRIDGTKLIAGTNGDLYRYSLSDDNDISTATYDTNTTTTGGYENLAIYNGTGSYVVGAAFNGVIYNAALSTDYDLNSSSGAGSNNLASTVGTNARGWAFNSDGTKLYVANSASVVFQFSVSPAYTGAPSYDSKSIDLSTNLIQCYGLLVSPDDKLLIALDVNTDTVEQYSFGTIDDVTTVTYDSVSISVTTEDTLPYGIFYNNAKTKIIMVGYNTDKFYQYSF